MNNPSVNVQDLLPTYRHLFTEATLKLLDAEPARQQMELYDNGIFNLVVGFGYVVTDELKAIEKLAPTINELVSFGYVTKFLAGLSKIDLYAFNLAAPEFAVITFPMLTPEGQAFVKDGHYDSACPDGALPRRL